MRNLLDFYFSAGSTRAFLDAALLVYRPPLLDILPIYVVFLALSPMALVMGTRLGWRYPFAASATVWLLAQLGLRGLVHGFLSRAAGLQIPLNETGAFDLWAWQLWWLVGLWLGVRWARNDLRLLTWADRFYPHGALVAVAFLVLRYAQISGVVSLARFDPLLDKWTLGGARIIDFAAVAMVALRFRSPLQRLAFRPLVMLGQNSLEVFCAQLFCVFCALTTMGNRLMVSGWAAMALVLSSWSTLFHVSAIVRSRRAARRATRDPGAGAAASRWRTVGWAMAGTVSVAGIVFTAR